MNVFVVVGKRLSWLQKYFRLTQWLNVNEIYLLFFFKEVLDLKTNVPLHRLNVVEQRRRQGLIVLFSSFGAWVRPNNSNTSLSSEGDLTY